MKYMSGTKTPVISFDFDGVFVRDSDAIFKKEAWGVALAAYRGTYEQYLHTAQTLFGHGKRGGRKEIFGYVFEHLGVPHERIPAVVEEAASVFDTYVQKKIREAGLVPGAQEMLEQLASMPVSLYLNSGTATQALQTSARTLNIDHFFKDILGSTPEPHGGSKVDNLTYIATQERVEHSEVLMVGDSSSDREAAEALGCPFVGVANKWNGWSKQRVEFPLVDHLQEIPSLLDTV